MKKTIALLLAAAMVCAMMLACTDKSPAAPAAAPAAPAADLPEAKPEEPQAEADKVMDLCVSVANYSKGTAVGDGAAYFLEKAAEYSNGTITGDVFYDNSLGDMATQVSAVKTGSIDILILSTSYYSSIVPEVQAFDLPFMFADITEARKVVDGKAGQTVAKMYEGSGIKVIGYWENGMRELTNNARPIHSVEDVKGLNLRTMPVDMQIKAWETFGANVTPIDGSEIYSALQLGVVDGQENPLSGIASGKYYEVQKYLTLTHHVYSPLIFGMNEAKWESFSEAQQEALIKAYDDSTIYFRDLCDTGTEAALQTLKDNGMIVDEAPDVSGFVALTPEIYKIFTDQYGDEVIRLINESK